MKTIDRVFFVLLLLATGFVAGGFLRIGGVVLRAYLFQRIERQIEELHNPPD